MLMLPSLTANEFNQDDNRDFQRTEKRLTKKAKSVFRNLRIQPTIPSLRFDSLHFRICSRRGLDVKRARSQLTRGIN